MQRHGCIILPTDQNAPRFRLVETTDQIHNRALAAACWPHQRNRFPAFDLQVEFLQYRLGRVVVEIDVLELDGQRWLVAPYGPVSWVANARVAGEVTLSRGGRSQQFEVEEAASTAAVPVLRNYITEIRVTGPYFDAGPSSTDEEIAAELPTHPVFRLVPH